MKIEVYKIERVTPKNGVEEDDLCKLFNLPSLRFGGVEVIGNDYEIKIISKKEFKSGKLVRSKYYNYVEKAFVDGFLNTVDYKFYRVIN